MRDTRGHSLQRAAVQSKTRWWSKLDCMSQLHENFDKIDTLLADARMAVRVT